MRGADLKKETEEYLSLVGAMHDLGLFTKEEYDRMSRDADNTVRTLRDIRKELAYEKAGIVLH